MKCLAGQLLLVLVFFGQVTAQTDVIQKTQGIVREVIEKSYPELKNKQIEIKVFKSESDYFQARFSFFRHLTFQKMRYLILVNPKIFERSAPTAGIRSIIAHELAHILYYAERNRFELLGLVKLSSKTWTRKFERRADLESIARGYGNGLIEYRKWLYQNIPPKKTEEKKRNYFSPEEIELMLEMLRHKPALIEHWRKNIPFESKDLTQ